MAVKGLILTPNLAGAQVSSVEMKFEPSIGIMARKIDKLGLDIRSFREPLKRAIQRVVIPSIQENFAVGGRPAWEPLSEDWKKQKTTDQILIETGALRRTMGQFNIWTVDREKAMLTDLPASVWYGKVHQGGATFTVRTAGIADMAAHQAQMDALRRLGINPSGGGTGEIPQRRFVMFQQEDVPKIHLIFEEWLAERIAMAGLR